jgi:hypothetical protein
MRTSRFSFAGIWTKKTKIPRMKTSSLPQKKTPRTLPPTTTRQQEGSCVVDHRLQKMTGTPATMPVLVVVMVAAAATMVVVIAAMMIPARPLCTSATSPQGPIGGSS